MLTFELVSVSLIHLNHTEAPHVMSLHLSAFIVFTCFHTDADAHSESTPPRCLQWKGCEDGLGLIFEVKCSSRRCGSFKTDVGSELSAGFTWSDSDWSTAAPGLPSREKRHRVNATLPVSEATGRINEEREKPFSRKTV